MTAEQVTELARRLRNPKRSADARFKERLDEATTIATMAAAADALDLMQASRLLLLKRVLGVAT